MSDWNREDDDDLEEENFEGEFKTFDDHIIFLIDGRENMFRTNVQGEELILNSLKVALAVMKTKVIATNRATVGISFFGVTSGSTDVTLGNIFNFIPLETPNAASIKKIQSLITNPENSRNTITPQPPAISSCPLKTSLWNCAQSFNTKTRKLANDACYRRIWLFTCDDNPNAHDRAEQDRIIQVAKDAYETGIEISLWHYSTPSGADFDYSKFYHRLLKAGSAASEEDGDEDDLSIRIQSGGPEDSFDSLLAQVRRKEFNKRPLGSIRLQLSSELQLTVNMYKIIQAAKKPLKTWLVSRTNQPAKSSTRLISKETGAVVDALQISTFVDFASELIPFTRSEMLKFTVGNENLLGQLSEDTAVTGGFLKIMYFCPYSALGLELNISSPIFIFPNDMKIKGSACLFTALYDDMLAKQLIAIGVFIRNKSSQPKVVALIPQLEVIPEDSEKQGCAPQPGGMNIVTLPYDSEIRVREGGSRGLTKVSEEVVEAAENLVKALEMDPSFDYTTIENPSLQRFYSVLQAVALGEEEADWNPEEHDMLQPDPEGLAAHREEVLALLAVSGCTSYDESSAPSKGAAKKRSAAESGEGGSKRVKHEPGSADSGSADDLRIWKDEIQSGSINKRTVADLKEICKSIGEKVTGTKQVLIDRITASLSK